MNVSLPEALEKFVHKQVSSQRYQTASEVVRHALRLMQQEEAGERAQLKALRREIEAGFEQLARGKFVEGKDLSVERIRNLARRQSPRGKTNGSHKG